MILEEATHEAFGYYSSELSRWSRRPILVVCKDCGKIRKIRKDNHSDLCRSCSIKGKHHTDETKIKISAAHVGEKAYNWKPKVKCVCQWCGKHFEVHHSQTKKGEGKYCSRTCNHAAMYKGGRSLTWARTRAKRRQQLGYTLLMPLNEGEVGHHITNTYVIPILKEVHKNFTGYSRRKHRIHVLQWLKTNDKKKYLKVLCILAKQPLKQDK